jgi:hypothetical protein
MWVMKIRQANLQIASTALLTLGFLGSVSVRPLHAPERQRRKPSGGGPVFSPRNDGIVGGPSVWAQVSWSVQRFNLTVPKQGAVSYAAQVINFLTSHH